MDEMASEALAGRLLVATPMLGDPNFRRTVVLVVEHEREQGTLGVVLNRPTKVPVAHVPGTDEPVGWHPLESGAQPIPGAVARIGLVDLDAPPGLLAAAIVSLRVYAGYAGWSAGQLQAEIEEGAWYVLPAEPSDAFCPEPEQLWPAVLRRQGGELAYVATYPDDPGLN